VHIYAVMDGNEEQLDPPVLTTNYEAGEYNRFTWNTTRRGGRHEPEEVIGSKVGGIDLSGLLCGPLIWCVEFIAPVR
jgi:hypothetical protein